MVPDASFYSAEHLKDRSGSYFLSNFIQKQDGYRPEWAVESDKWKDNLFRN